ncbi:MAG: ABC transporter ATP-binding protein [Bacteroidota bacterium]|jgi:peptide/nickel transport system ATP-binding protein/oligopeptide transport system ATP-binding protein
MTAPLLVADGLVKHFVAKRSVLGRPLSLVRAVDGVSFELNSGETLALVGESGCGKSTVGRLVLRLIEPTAGRVTFAGRDITTLPSTEVRRFRSQAQLIFQDPYASLNPRMMIGDTLGEPLLLHASLSAADRRARVGELLGMVGLRREHAERYPHEFSGGQRQRIAIARALAAEPKLIVCDEPVSALDVSIRSQILNLLKDLQQRLGLAYIFISHDLAVVKHIATRVAVMYLGRIVETGKAEDIFAEPRHPYTQALLSAIPVPSHVGRRQRRLLPGDPPSPIDPPSGCHLHPRCEHAVEVCRRTPPTLTADDGLHATACHRWRDIRQSSPGALPEGELSPQLQRLISAFDGRS